jgi:hypothetical protein
MPEKSLCMGGSNSVGNQSRLGFEEQGCSENGARAAQDPYANYVLQSALSVSSGALHMDLVDAMRPYLPSLRGTPHGKRILSKINVKI